MLFPLIFTFEDCFLLNNAGSLFLNWLYFEHININLRGPLVKVTMLTPNDTIPSVRVPRLNMWNMKRHLSSFLVEGSNSPVC